MKPLLATAAAVSALLVAASVSAQTVRPEPVARADVLGAFGWLNVNRADLQPYDDWGNDWVNEIALIGGGFGWYWTDHLKTEIDGGVSSAATQYGPSVILVAGRPQYGYSRYTFSSRQLAISQQYQFFRNVWFHPHLSVGVDLTWEKTSREDEAVYAYDPNTRQPVAERRTFPTDTDLRALPFAEAGFKAYMTERSFFRTDMRLSFSGGIERVLFRFGFGADF
jgi:hypothetical protein